MAGDSDAWVHEWRDLVLSEYGPPQSGARLVACAIAKQADRSTHETYIGAALLAAFTGLDERTVRDHRRRLEAGGWLSSRARRGRGRGRQWRLELPPGLPEKSTGNRARSPEDFGSNTGKKQRDHRKKPPTIPVPIPVKIPGSAGAPAPDARAPRAELPKSLMPASERIEKRLAARRTGGGQ